MADGRPVVVTVVGNADPLEKTADQAAKAIDKLGDDTVKSSSKVGILGATSDRVKGRTDELAESLKQRLGPAGTAAGGSIDKAVGVINKMPVAALGAAGAVAALVAGLVALGTASIKAFGTAVAETQQVQAIIGSTAEEASVFAEVFKEVGLNVDATADVLENFGSLTKQDLVEMEKMGVQLDKNADGTVNYAGTLRNLLTEMAGTTDQTRRAELGSKAFGEQWFRLKPLLDRGEVSLNQLMDAAERGELGEIITDEDIEAQKEFDAAIRTVKETFNDILVTLGKELVPIVGDAIENFAIFADGLANINDKVPVLEYALKGAAAPLSALASGIGALGGLLGGQAKAADDAAASTDALAQAEEQAVEDAEAIAEAEKIHEEVLKDLADAEDRAREAHEERVNKSVELITGIDSVAAAERNIERALSDQAAKYWDLDAAIRDHGPTSEESRIAALNLADAQDDSKRAVAEAAQAFADNRIKQLEAQGVILSTDEKLDIQREGWRQLAETLGPDHPLAAHINGIIGQLDAVPRHVPIRVTLEAAGISGQVTAIREQIAGGLRIGGNRAMGGPAHGVVNVGERGPETVILPRGSRVIPNHAGGGSNGNTINVNVRTNANPNEIAREIAWQLRRSGR